MSPSPMQAQDDWGGFGDQNDMMESMMSDLGIARRTNLATMDDRRRGAPVNASIANLHRAGTHSYGEALAVAAWNNFVDIPGEDGHPPPELDFADRPTGQTWRLNRDLARGRTASLPTSHPSRHRGPPERPRPTTARAPPRPQPPPPRPPPTVSVSTLSSSTPATSSQLPAALRYMLANIMTFALFNTTRIPEPVSQSATSATSAGSMSVGTGSHLAVPDDKAPIVASTKVRTRSSEPMAASGCADHPGPERNPQDADRGQSQMPQKVDEELKVQNPATKVASQSQTPVTETANPKAVEHTISTDLNEFMDFLNSI